MIEPVDAVRLTLTVDTCVRLGEAGVLAPDALPALAIGRDAIRPDGA
jgi:hypothetical protein